MPLEASSSVEDTAAIHVSGMQYFQWAVVVVAAGISTVTDLRNRRIPNLITLPLIVAGPVVLGVAYGWSGVLASFLGLLLLGVPYVLIWMSSGGGAGDAKLMMGIGAWVGPAIGIWMLLTTVVAGGIFALAAAAIYGRLRELPYSVVATIMKALPGRSANVQHGQATAGVGNDAQEATAEATWIPFAPVILIGTVLGGVLWAIYARR